jgi:aryl-alcohol dehydrogenase-like predicted oxidoreductase
VTARSSSRKGPRSGSKTSRPPSRAPPSAVTSTEAAIPLGKSGLLHPAIGLGLFALGRWTREDEARTKATIGRALERGIRWFDTAEVYGSGRSERVLGECLLRTASGVRPFVVTKVSWEHLRPNQLRAALIGSLQRLARPSVDLYLVHAPNPHVPLKETMGALEALWKEGKVSGIGVSNFSLAELEEAQRGLSETAILVNQVRYNLFDRDDAEPVQEYCRSHGILIEAYSPLARGLLTGRYLDGSAPPAEVRRMAHGLFEEKWLPEILRRAQTLHEVADQAGVSMTSIALHWLRSKGAVPVWGASRPEQVDATLDAWQEAPSSELLQRAEAIARGDRD